MDHQGRARTPGPVAALLMMGWLTVVLLIDGDGTLTQQRLLGVGTWVVLAVALTRFAPLIRVQTGVVVVFATLVEYAASPGLEVYLYRFHNVPMYVPPGHGLVYLSAYALGHAVWLRSRLDLATVLVVLGLGTWAVVSLTHDPRDVLGALWFLCLVGFLRWGPSREVYVGAAVVVTWLEIAGTSLGTWVWQPIDPTGLIPIGNPPTGAAGGYGWFDLAGILLAPWLIRRWAARPGSGRRGRDPVTSAAGRSAPADVDR